MGITQWEMDYEAFHRRINMNAIVIVLLNKISYISISILA